VDWCTLTASEKGRGSDLWAIGDRLLSEHAGKGDSPVPWQMKGYRGWSATGLRVGSRPSGCILSMSGTECGKNWRDGLRAAENCSRLDLAVDSHFDPVHASLSGDVYREVGHRPSRTGRPVSSRLILGSDGGSTVYIGSRVSEWFGRLYDKGIEQGTHRRGFWWRWELELKGGAALRCANRLESIENECHPLQRIVATWFRDRSGYSFAPLADLAIGNGKPEPTSTDRQLHWLSAQVRPTVQHLLATVGTAKVLDALGLHPQSAVDPTLTQTEYSYASSSRRPVADDYPTHESRPGVRERHHDAGQRSVPLN